MEGKVGSEGAQIVVALAGEVTVADATAFRDLMRTALDRQGSVAVDASRVERLDTSALQVLVSARVSCARQGRAFVVRGLVPSCLSTWRLLGGPEDLLA